MKIQFIRHASFVEICANNLTEITIEDFVNDGNDQDFSFNEHVTGHLMLLDDREEKAYMLNDYGVDVIEVLNQDGMFNAPLSILTYSDFKTYCIKKHYPGYESKSKNKTESSGLTLEQAKADIAYTAKMWSNAGGFIVSQEEETLTVEESNGEGRIVFYIEEE